MKIIIILLLASSFMLANVAFSKTDIEALKKERQMQLANALQGDSIAQWYLGVTYYNGYGVDVNYEEAAKWLALASDQGVHEAQLILAYMYINGEGVKTDNNKAISLFQPSANDGDVGAQYNLGVIYYNGEGVKQDYVNALKWFTLAAIKDDENALFMLGTMYQEGIGVEKDRYAAKQFYGKSCHDKNSEACKRFWVLENEDTQRVWSSKN